MNLDPTRIMASLKRSGYAHVARDTDRAELDQVCEELGLAVMEDNAMFTRTVRLKGHKEHATIESLRAQLGRKRR